MNIVGKKIQKFEANNNWTYSSVDNFLKDKVFSFLNICLKNNDKYEIYYILADEDLEIISEKKEKVSI